MYQAASDNYKIKKMKNYMHFYSVFLLFVFNISCNGQNNSDPPKNNISQPENKLPDYDPYFIETKTITSSYGPSSITRNMIQDRDGNIWLATWEGILRYDGETFTNFTNKEGLRRFHVFTALEDRSGNIWFGTIGAGVYRYDGKTFTNFTTKEGLAGDRIGCIMQDRAGNIWIGTDGGVSIYNGDSFRNFTTE